MVHQYFVVTEDYPFVIDFREIVPNEKVEFFLVTKIVQHDLTEKQLQAFKRVLVVDPWNSDEVERLIAQELRDPKAARVLSHDDTIYELLIGVRERLKIPGPSRDSLAPFLDKGEMKRRLFDSPVRTPKFICFDALKFINEGEGYIQKILEELSFPMFVKPRNGAGSMNIAKIFNEGELKAWCEAHKHTQHFEIDEFVEIETMYHVDSVVRGGRNENSQVSRYAFPCAEYKDGKVLGSLMIPSGTSEAQDLLEVSDNVLEAYARFAPVPDGVMHLEVFRNRQGELIFAETQLRPPGANAKKVFEFTHRVHLEDIHYRLQMEIENIPSFTRKEGYGAWAFFPTKTGYVKEVRIPKLKSHLRQFDNFLQAGQQTRAADNIFNLKARGLIALSLLITSECYEDVRDDFDQLATFEPFELHLA